MDFHKYETRLSKLLTSNPRLQELTSTINSVIDKITSLEGEWSYQGRKLTYRFLYDEENDLWHTFSGDSELLQQAIIPVRAYTLSDLIMTFSKSGCHRVTLVLDGNFPQLSGFKRTVSTHKDYSKMVTELERTGVLKTAPSNFAMANDPRKFTFRLDEDLSLPEAGSEVDCLGTVLCEDLTREVEKRLGLGNPVII